MAIPTNAPAGFGTGFDADAFRQAIRATMTMGLPNATADRATFRWTTAETFAIEDQDHNPYDWTDTPATSDAHADVQIPVAFEFAARPAASLDNPMGQFDSTRVEITILDVDFPLIEGANEVVLGENTYDIDFVGPPRGLFEVDVYTIYATARDET